MCTKLNPRSLSEINRIRRREKLLNLVLRKKAGPLLALPLIVRDGYLSDDNLIPLI